MVRMIKLNRKLEQEGFVIGMGGRDWFGRRGEDIVVKRWANETDEPGVLCRSLASERAKRAAVQKPARGLRTRCERALTEAVQRGFPVFVVFAHRAHASDGSTEAAWPENEPLELVPVASPVYVDGAWLMGEAAPALRDTVGADEKVQMRELQYVLRKLRPEQEKFAQAVFEACAGRCIITGVGAGAVLDAAHRHGRSWEAGHNAASDGWLLRADVHRALDADLISISLTGALERCDSKVAYIGAEYRALNASAASKRSL